MLLDPIKEYVNLFGLTEPAAITQGLTALLRSPNRSLELLPEGKPCGPLLGLGPRATSRG